MEMELMSSMKQQWNMLGNGLKESFWKGNGSIQMEPVTKDNFKTINPKVWATGTSLMEIKSKATMTR